MPEPNIISVCDFFGESNYLRYERRNHYKTVCGGLLSLFMVLIFLAIIVYKLYQIFWNAG